MSQLSLFDGDTIEAARDESRLKAQLVRVSRLMADGKWRTLNQIACLTHDPPASVSARLRDLRKEKFGGYLVERRYLSKGLFTYRVEAR